MIQMKKILFFFTVCLLVMSLSCCGGKTNHDGTSVSDSDIDVDLTTLSNTMVYSEVYYMMQSPQRYVGKTVKMQGTYTVYDGDTRKYHACLIADATACCAQGIEFELTSDYRYPDDYPQEGAQITVIGIFDLYSEGNYQYCQLSHAEIVA